MKSVKVALLQMKMEQAPEANLAKAQSFISKAAAQGAHIVCLPELFLTPYFCQAEEPKNFGLAETIPGPTTTALMELAKRCRVALIASLFEKTPKGEYYNTAIVLNRDGSFLGKYRKTHIPDDLKNHYGEAYYFKSGNLGYPVFETPFARIGVMVCWDQWYPEGARLLASKGAQIIFYPTAIGFPEKDKAKVRKAEREAWYIVQRSHAISNNIFVAVANRVGKESHLIFWGGSFVVDPSGQIVAVGTDHQEEIVMASCSLDQIQTVRQDWPFLGCRQIHLHER